MNYKLFPFDVIGDERGKLISLEGNKNIPFEIKRMYYIFDTMPEKTRGKHAHTKLEQIVIAMHGSCEFLLDDGQEKQKITLNNPSIGLYIGTNIWREMHNLSHDCKLVVLASDFYNEDEYIRDYQEFLQSLPNKKNLKTF